MKFVFLNRELVNAPLVSELRREGHGVFVCTEVREAEIVLKVHGDTITLVLAHDQPGLELISLMKASPGMSATPVVLTHSIWRDAEFAKHRSGKEAVEAYHAWPVGDQVLRKSFDQILKTGSSEPPTVATGEYGEGDISVFTQGISLASVESSSTSGGPVLEDATSQFQPDAAEGNDFLIDLPIMEAEPEAPIATEEAAPVLSPPATDFLIGIGSPQAELDPEALPDIGEPTVAPTLVMGGTPVSVTSQTSVTEVDPDALTQMPYLQRSGRISPLAYAPPMDDAMVPGGAAQAPDVETLKKYLLLREQDVLALSSQVKQAKDQVASLEQQLRQERATNTEFAHLLQEQGRRIDTFDKEKEIAAESAQREVEDLKFELKRRTDRTKLLEHQVKEAMLDTERLKERVRLDIRKIRVREKELENRLEIMKKDSEALLSAREQKIVELKRKLDLAEFNADLLQDQLEKERAASAQLRAKLEKAAQVVRVAGGLLHPADGEASTEAEGTSLTERAKDPAA